VPCADRHDREREQQRAARLGHGEAGDADQVELTSEHDADADRVDRVTERHAQARQIDRVHEQRGIEGTVVHAGEVAPCGARGGRCGGRDRDEAAERASTVGRSRHAEGVAREARNDDAQIGSGTVHDARAVADGEEQGAGAQQADVGDARIEVRSREMGRPARRRIRHVQPEPGHVRASVGSAHAVSEEGGIEEEDAQRDRNGRGRGADAGDRSQSQREQAATHGAPEFHPIMHSGRRP
jgi:hypothetical protein